MTEIAVTLEISVSTVSIAVKKGRPYVLSSLCPLCPSPWTDHHPKDFKYLGEKHDSIEATDKARETYTDAACYEIGIVTNYGLTGFGNDFSEYSAMIFTYPKEFKEIMNQYPRVRGKFLVWLEFYQKIDPIFTEEYLLGPKMDAAQ